MAHITQPNNGVAASGAASAPGPSGRIRPATSDQQYDDDTGATTTTGSAHVTAPVPMVMAHSDVLATNAGGGGGAAAGTGSTSTGTLNGCWVASASACLGGFSCSGYPIPCIWALYYNQSIGPDRVKGSGCIFPLGVIPCCFQETRTRQAGTNRFVHDHVSSANAENPDDSPDDVFDGTGIFSVFYYDNPRFNCFPKPGKKRTGICNLRLC